MGGPARPLHEPGNHRSSERCSPRQSADCGSLTIPASPAGAHETSAALTPLLGARSLSTHSGGTFTPTNLVCRAICSPCCMSTASHHLWPPLPTVVPTSTVGQQKTAGVPAVREHFELE